MYTRIIGKSSVREICDRERQAHIYNILQTKDESTLIWVTEGHLIFVVLKISLHFSHLVGNFDVKLLIIEL